MDIEQQLKKGIKPKKETAYSYSRIEKFEQCGWRYKLTYVDRLYVQSTGLSAYVGTLVHSVEEQIANMIIEHKPVDYDYLRDYMQHVNIPETGSSCDTCGSKKGSKGGIYGTDILAEKFQSEYYALDKDGCSYFTKCQNYLNKGIYRLENYMKDNPNLELIAVEKEFNVHFLSYLFHGYIDRILFDHSTNKYVIEDIKTKGKPFPDKDLKTPLQFVVYSIAAKDLYNLDYYPETFYYDLPFLDMRQKAGAVGFLKRGTGILAKVFAAIKEEDFVPRPSPLCHWCEFCETNPLQPKEGRGYCPFYSLWTPGGTAKVWETKHKWEGKDKAEAIVDDFRKEIEGRESGAKVAAAFDFSEFMKEKEGKEKKTDDHSLKRDVDEEAELREKYGEF